jgi:hypothetical protein
MRRHAVVAADRRRRCRPDPYPIPHTPYPIRHTPYPRPQIRQLLFPDATEGGVRAFKVDNPHYEEAVARGDRPKPSRFMDMRLHGVWGEGVPGQLQVRRGRRAGVGAGGRGGGSGVASLGLG